MPKRLSYVCQVTPLLPVLVGVLTVVSMFAANAGKLGWGQLWAPLVFVVLWAVVCWLVFWLFPRGRRLSGILASVTVLVTMTWGLFPEVPYLTGSLVPFAVWMAVGYLVIRFHKAVIKALPVAAVVVMMAVLVSLGQSAFGIARSSGDVVASQAVAKADNAYPDIYVIIPDRFGSPEALKESGLDASWFVQELRDRGFYVRENAMSSDAYKAGEKAPQTTRTLRFLASLLNFGESVDLGMGYNEAGGMVRNPEAVRVLHSMGYICYNVGSWYPETAISRAADHNYVYRAANPVQWLYVQEFGAAVLDRSIWRYFIITGDQTERDRQMFQLGAVKEIASGDVAHPKFVFVHLLLPHPPFVWAADGQPQNGDSGEMTKYLEQVQFTEGYLLEMLDSIPDDAIVILESDEGICFTRPAFLNEGLSDTQWNGVLVAWRIAGADLAAVGHTEILGYAIDYLEGQ